MSDAVIEYRPSWHEVLVNRIKCKWQNFRDRNKPSNGELHARREFKAVGYVPPELDTEDGPNKWIQENVLELLKVFAKQGHSDFSAPYCIDAFCKLAKFEPLGPLTGAEAEWNEFSDGKYQNNRCSHVFKDKDRFDGKPYDIDGIVFWDWHTDPVTGEKHKSHFTNRDSAVVIEFPYIPTTKHQERIEEKE